jgi:stage III sporulation protein AF
MDWLGSWLKSIVLVILLATFVDILLPNHTMQRYVKTVMSLFILLTLLQPLFSLFLQPGSLDRLMVKADALIEDEGSGRAISAFGGPPGLPGDMETAGAIEARAKQLKSHQEQQSQRLVQQQLADLMKRDIEQSSAVTVFALQVETGKDTSGQLEIRNVHVEAAAVSKPSAVKEKPDAVKPVAVESVKPVSIMIDSGSKPVPAGDVQADRRNGQIAADDPAAVQRQAQIRMLLYRNWQVPLDRISIELTGKK